MKYLDFNIALKSTNPQKQTTRPKVFTNDLDSVMIRVTITDMTDTDLLGSSAEMLLYMQDRSFFQNTDVTREGNVFKYLLKENEGNHSGIARFQLPVTTADEKVYAQQKLEFEIISGLETQVATEVMIHDWNTLTREARAYIDEFELIVNDAKEQIQANIVEAAVEEKFNNLEAEYAEDLTEVKTQLADVATQINDLETSKAEKTEVNATNLRVDNLVIPISPENVNVEVTDAHNSIVKNKNFSSLKDRLEESEGDLAQHKLDYIEQQNTLFTTGKNLFNPYDTDIMVGYGLRSGGRIDPIDGNVTSGYIYVSKGDSIVTSKNNSLQWEYVTQYNVDKSYISHSSGNVISITNDNVKYVRVSITADLSVDKIQIEKGTARTGYEDFYYKLTEIVSPPNEVVDARGAFNTLGDRLEDVSNTIDAEPSNLLNPDTVIDNMMLQINGYLTASEGIYTSDFIEINEGDVLQLHRNQSMIYPYVFRWAAYNSDKSFISVSETNFKDNFICPEGAKYIRVSAKWLKDDGVMLQKGVKTVPYIPFGKKITASELSINSIEGNLKPNTQNYDIFKDNIFAVSENKLNINDDDYIIGGVLQSNGTILLYGDAAPQRVTGFIPIKENQKLWVYYDDHLGVSMYCAFYDSNKDFITYLEDTGYSLNAIEAPLNSSYVRVQANNTVFEERNCMIEISEQPTFYKPYGIKVNVSEVTGEWDNKKPLSKVLRKEIERVENKVVDIKSDFVYGWATDTHIQVETQLYKAQQMAELNKTGIMNVMFDGGDIVNGSNTKENVVKRLQRIARVYKDTPSDMVMIRGNHDIYWKYDGVSTVDDYTIDNHIWHNVACRHQENKAVFDSNNPQGGYYYKDYPLQKIRVVVLNTSDVLDDTGHWLGAEVGIPIDAKRIRQQQFSWFCNTALNFNGNGEGWGVITVAHAGLMTNSDLGSQGDNFSGVLNAFVTGGTFSLTTDPGTPFELVSNVDFTTQGAMEYIAHHCGDAHWDRVSYDLPIGKTPRIHTCNMGNLQKTPYLETGTIFNLTTPIRGTGGFDGDDTVECEVADIFNINRTTKTIIAIRYGAGVDRIIPYDKDVTISVSSTQALVSVLEGTLIWESKNPAISTVSNGVVTGVLAGQVVITATDINGQIEAWRVIVS